MIVQTANTFGSAIRMRRAEREVDLKSIISILTLGAGPGDVLVLRAAGADATAALDALEHLFKAGFGEG
jgi:phosphotransferase system HPr (HPr) family protein